MCTMKDPKNVILSAIYKNSHKGEKKIYKKKGSSTSTYTLALVSELGNGSCKVKISPIIKNKVVMDIDFFSFRQPVQLTEYLNKEYEEIVINMSKSEPLLRTKPPIKHAWTDPNEGQIPTSVQNPQPSRVLEKVAKLRAEAERKADRLAAEMAALVAEKERVIKAEEAKKSAADKAAEAAEAAEADRLAAETAALVAVKERAIKAAADKAIARSKENEKKKVEEAQATNAEHVSKFMKLLDAARKTEKNKEKITSIETEYNNTIFDITKKTTPVKELLNKNIQLQELIKSLESLNADLNAPPPVPPAQFKPPKPQVAELSDPIDSRTIHFYGNYEEEPITRFVNLARVLELRIAEGNWIHYEKQKDDNAIEKITSKYPYLHLKLTQTVGNWTVSGYVKTGRYKKYTIERGEFPPKNTVGRVGGSKMGRSTVLGRIMSIIRGSIKHVTRKKGRKPRSKTRRYKNKSQKKEKNKLNITKKVRFNRNKI